MGKLRHVPQWIVQERIGNAGEGWNGADCCESVMTGNAGAERTGRVGCVTEGLDKAGGVWWVFTRYVCVRHDIAGRDRSGMERIGGYLKGMAMQARKGAGGL